MRFYFQDRVAGNFATKCIRVSSTATTQDVIETLAEKFRPDMRMLSSPKYSLYEVHVSGGRFHRKHICVWICLLGISETTSSCACLRLCLRRASAGPRREASRCSVELEQRRQRGAVCPEEWEWHPSQGQPFEMLKSETKEPKILLSRLPRISVLHHVSCRLNHLLQLHHLSHERADFFAFSKWNKHSMSPDCLFIVLLSSHVSRRVRVTDQRRRKMEWSKTLRGPCPRKRRRRKRSERRSSPGFLMETSRLSAGRTGKVTWSRLFIFPINYIIGVQREVLVFL